MTSYPACRTERAAASCSWVGRLVTDDGRSKMLDIQTNQFQVVTCTNCGYSELYRDTGSAGSDLADIFLG